MDAGHPHPLHSLRGLLQQDSIHHVSCYCYPADLEPGGLGDAACAPAVARVEAGEGGEGGLVPGTCAPPGDHWLHYTGLTLRGLGPGGGLLDADGHGDGELLARGGHALATFILGGPVPSHPLGVHAALVGCLQLLLPGDARLPPKVENAGEVG